MRNKLLNRTWISPLTSVTFLVVGITGILLAFHVKNGGIMALHEWIGYAFALVGAIHLMVNWRSFVNLFRQRSALLAMTMGVVLSLAVMAAGSSGGGKQGKGNPLMQAFDLNGNGVIDANEVTAASASLARLDANGDGIISMDELMARHGGNGKDSTGHTNRPAAPASAP